MSVTQALARSRRVLSVTWARGTAPYVLRDRESVFPNRPAFIPQCGIADAP